VQIRRAVAGDLEEIAAADSVARTDPARVAFLRAAIGADDALVAVASGSIVGYAVLDHSFYGNAFLSLLVVRADARRKGCGTALLRAAEARARTPKIFTSTNESNAAMQALLASAGYQRSGVIENLDVDDRELVYVRFLDDDAA